MCYFCKSKWKSWKCMIDDSFYIKNIIKFSLQCKTNMKSAFFLEIPNLKQKPCLFRTNFIFVTTDVN